MSTPPGTVAPIPPTNTTPARSRSSRVRSPGSPSLATDVGHQGLALCRATPRRAQRPPPAAQELGARVRESGRSRRRRAGFDSQRPCGIRPLVLNLRPPALADLATLVTYL